MSTHTPGPWTAIGKDELTVNGGMFLVESIGVSVEEIAYTHTEDNARLIAKAPIAPKLAEALRYLLGNPESDEAREQADAALAEWDAQS